MTPEDQIKNNQGFLAADFLFAITISAGLMAVLFAITYTLCVTEVVQYMAFSVARAQSASHVSPAAQEDAGRRKYQKLIGEPRLQSLFASGWFSVPKPNQIEIAQGDAPPSNGRNLTSDYSQGGDTTGDMAIPFHGVRIRFAANMLNFNVPFIGKTSSEDAEDGAFSAMITGFLIREPSQLECQNFMMDRGKAILALDPRFQNSGSNGQVTTFTEDNGC